MRFKSFLDKHFRKHCYHYKEEDTVDRKRLIFYRQFQKLCSCVRKSMLKIDEKCLSPARFFPLAIHVEYASMHAIATIHTYISIPLSCLVEFHPSILAHSTVRNDIRRCSIEFSFPCATTVHTAVIYTAVT